ncbi:hypothetical protein MPLDJ20_150497 [Mesorhizobium plurifarium]|uniref:Uncharacterized protein n=1 Tax=Mesorhizobium plurifarium TaxID=69974 RepID=A0A090EVG8_MESPL|nr:hypothetical protein MPLDJ20_150497 [Mesorhizobium plurifarium]
MLARHSGNARQEAAIRMLRASPCGRPDIENLTACLSIVTRPGPGGALNNQAHGYDAQTVRSRQKSLSKSHWQKVAVKTGD